ncbi:hypothetical protein K439DRAFT_1617029 [Ramaria rubella]|nr:hypothetical protein K439DRAFT_1617029 [Ramaria rubella]
MKAAFVYNHAVDAYVEFPCSSENAHIAHKFAINPNPMEFMHPKGNIVYGLGAPIGQHNDRLCELLTDQAGVKVRCKETTLTYFRPGVLNFVRNWTPAFARHDLQEHWGKHTTSAEASSAGAILLNKTVALKAALDKHGCGCPRDESTLLLSVECELVDKQKGVLQQERWGQPLLELCEGWLIFGRYKDNKAFIKCEHYTSGSQHHLIDHRVQETNDEYMEAMFDDDRQEIARIEELAKANSYRPLMPCFTIANSSSMRSFCSHEHRDEAGNLVQGKMVVQPCKVKFQIYKPYDLIACPFVLILVSGAHTHPIPLPLSTPAQVKGMVLDLLR